MTSSEIKMLLSLRHPKPNWAFWCELPDGTGIFKCRTIDAFAVSMWSNPGIGHSIAYEIKISRSDFMNEIKDPGKRKPFIDNSSEFYYVMPQGLVQPEELPSECGLLEILSNNNLKIKKIATQRRIEGYDAPFFASLMRQSDGRELTIDKVKFFRFLGKTITLKDLQQIFDKTQKGLEDIYLERVKADVRREYYSKIDSEFKGQLKTLKNALGLMYTDELNLRVISVHIEDFVKKMEEFKKMKSISHIILEMKTLIHNLEEKDNESAEI